MGNIQKKEDGPDTSFSNNNFSSVTLNELALKARGSAISIFNKPINTKWGPNTTKMFRIYDFKSVIFSDSSEYFSYTMDDAWRYSLGLPQGTTPAALTTNKNI